MGGLDGYPAAIHASLRWYYACIEEVVSSSLSTGLGTTSAPPRDVEQIETGLGFDGAERAAEA